MQDPQAFCDTLNEKYMLKLKGVSPISYYFGCAYTRDKDGTLVANPRKYVSKILESYKKIFEEKPKTTQRRTYLTFVIKIKSKNTEQLLENQFGFLDWGDLTLQYMS